MKQFTLFLLLTFVFGREAMAQRCNDCTTGRNYTISRPSAPGPVARPSSAPRPNSRHVPAVRLVCAGTDLYNYQTYLHRFSSERDCRAAKKVALRKGKFCDQGTMFNRRGVIVRTFSSQADCSRSLH